MSTTRRQFLKLLGVGTAAVAVGPAVIRATELATPKKSKFEELWDKLASERTPGSYSLILGPEMKFALTASVEEKRIRRKLLKAWRRTETIDYGPAGKLTFVDMPRLYPMPDNDWQPWGWKS